MIAGAGVLASTITNKTDSIKESISPNKSVRHANGRRRSIKIMDSEEEREKEKEMKKIEELKKEEE